MPCPGPFHSSHSVDYFYEFCPLPDPDVGPSIFVTFHKISILLVCVPVEGTQTNRMEILSNVCTFVAQFLHCSTCL